MPDLELPSVEDLWSDETLWAVTSTASAVAGALLVRKGLEKAWEAWRGEPPPQNPEASATRWGEALAWAAAVGLAAGVGRLLARRGAAAGWRKVKGHVPPGLER